MEIALRRLIGHQVVVMGPTFVDNEKLHSVKLLAVEEAGIVDREPGSGRQSHWETTKETLVGGPRLLRSLRANYDHRGRFRALGRRVAATTGSQCPDRFHSGG